MCSCHLRTDSELQATVSASEGRQQSEQGSLAPGSLEEMKMKISYLQATHADACGPQEQREASQHILAEAIALTAEICGQPLSSAAAELLAFDLGDFADSLILAALARCRMELHGPMKVAEILARIDDGRPDVDEAWNMLPKNEQASVVWTEEMAESWGVVLPLLDAGDVGGARDAFRETYAKAVLQARIRRMPSRWTPSFGSDPGGRDRALRAALQERRLTLAQVEQLLPAAGASSVERIAVQREFKSLH
jgi:hypothetical protein